MRMDIFRIGLDIHGVLDVNSDILLIVKALKLLKNYYGIEVEVHIITGNKYDSSIINWLKVVYGNDHIWWDKYFSIQDYLEEKYPNEAMWIEGKDLPFFPDELWNQAKADYCKEKEIDLHFDNSEEYLSRFTTNCFLYKHKIKS